MKRDTYCDIIKATGIENGDLVLIQYWMNDIFSDDIAYLQAELAAAGATVMLVVQNIKLSQLLNENVTENTYNDRYFKLYEDADVVIDFMERPIGVLSRPLEPEKMGLLGAYMGRLFKTCAGKKKLIQLRIPTPEMAKADGIEPEEYKVRVEAAMDIDYQLLNKECCDFRAQVEKSSGVEIVTKEGECRIEMSFEGRKWMIDAGDGDLPCGEVYIAPVESSVNGSVFFKTIYLPSHETRGEHVRFDDVELTINQGLITDINNEKLNAYLSELEEQDRTVCELGFGMNPGVTSLCGCEFLDEKMTGTFHIGIGNNVMFGGNNEAKDHNDLIGTGEYKWM